MCEEKVFSHYEIKKNKIIFSFKFLPEETSTNENLPCH